MKKKVHENGLASCLTRVSTNDFYSYLVFLGSLFFSALFHLPLHLRSYLGWTIWVVTVTLTSLPSGAEVPVGEQTQQHRDTEESEALGI